MPAPEESPMRTHLPRDAHGVEARAVPDVRPQWRRWALLGAVVAVIAAVFASGAHRYLTLSTLVDYHAALEGLVARNILIAVGLYVLAYALAVTLSLPGAAVFTVSGGFLFGGVLGGALAVVASTLGAAGVFFLARTALGGALAERAGPALRKLGRGVRDGAWSYMLFLRFVPVFPFWLVNLAPALFNVPLRVFVVTTFVGTMPATFAFAFAGAAFARLVDAQAGVVAACRASGRTDCAPAFDPSGVVTTELIVALVALGLVSLVPLVLKRRAAPDAEA
jgi:uncharacterized membrane protein YdjX (TVP38/TMEM64 family)